MWGMKMQHTQIKEIWKGNKIHICFLEIFRARTRLLLFWGCGWAFVSFLFCLFVCFVCFVCRFLTHLKRGAFGDSLLHNQLFLFCFPP